MDGAAKRRWASSRVVVMLISGPATIAAHIAAGSSPIAHRSETNLLANSGNVVGGTETSTLSDPGAPRVIAADVPTPSMAVFFIAHWKGGRTEALTRAVAFVVVSVGVSIVAGCARGSIGNLATGGRHT